MAIDAIPFPILAKSNATLRANLIVPLVLELLAHSRAFFTNPKKNLAFLIMLIEYWLFFFFTSFLQFMFLISFISLAISFILFWSSEILSYSSWWFDSFLSLSSSCNWACNICSFSFNASMGFVYWISSSSAFLCFFISDWTFFLSPSSILIFFCTSLISSFKRLIFSSGVWAFKLLNSSTTSFSSFVKLVNSNWIPSSHILNASSWLSTTTFSSSFLMFLPLIMSL